MYRVLLEYLALIGNVMIEISDGNMVKISFVLAFDIIIMDASCIYLVKGLPEIHKDTYNDIVLEDFCRRDVII